MTGAGGGGGARTGPPQGPAGPRRGDLVDSRLERAPWQSLQIQHDLPEHRGGDLASVIMTAARLVDDDDPDEARAIRRSVPGEARNVHAASIGPGRRVVLLRGSRL